MLTDGVAPSRLSVFASGFTLEAAEAVCADDELVDRYGVLDLLAHLIDKFKSTTAGLDIALETIRQYSGSRLVEAENGPAYGGDLGVPFALFSLARLHVG